mgnify:CR=1 FL=1
MIDLTIIYYWCNHDNGLIKRISFVVSVSVYWVDEYPQCLATLRNPMIKIPSIYLGSMEGATHPPPLCPFQAFCIRNSPKPRNIPLPPYLSPLVHLSTVSTMIHVPEERSRI